MKYLVLVMFRGDGKEFNGWRPYSFRCSTLKAAKEACKWFGGSDYTTIITDDLEA